MHMYINGWAVFLLHEGVKFKAYACVVITVKLSVCS